MSEFKANCSIDKADRLSIAIDRNKASASVCIVYNGLFSQVILSKEDIHNLIEFVKESESD